MAHGNSSVNENHYTVCILFSEDIGQVLLVRKNKTTYKGILNGPGGAIEENEDPYDGALREIREETGLDAGDLRSLGTVRLAWLGELRLGDDCKTCDGSDCVLHYFGGIVKPGAMSKKMNHNATAAILRKDREICDSTRPVYYTIEDDEFLKKLDRRNYYDENGEMHMLDYAKDKHLIGRRLGFRSPCTCTSTEGVCAACYGGLFDINVDLFSQGSLAATKTSEPTSQLILKQKHSQFTSSGEINFNDFFYQVFDIASTEVTLTDDVDLASELLMQLGPVDVEETDDGDAYRVDYFDIIDYDGNVKGRVQEEHEYPLYLAKEMVAAYKQAAGHPIPLSRFNDIADEVILFNIEIKSKAVSQSLQLITQALDSKDHLGCARDVDGLCQKFGRIMIDSGIAYPFVHNEMIIRTLMRKIGSETEFPDFSANGDHDDYEILRLTWSLRKNPSPIIRLSTGWLKSSLTSTTLYESTAPCHFDALFVPKLTDVI